MSDSNSKNALDSIVKAVIERDGSSTADTMLVNAHLSQMKMFGIRQGVEFFPQQDNLGTQRFDFIQQVIKFNKLDARLDFTYDLQIKHIEFIGLIKMLIDPITLQRVI